MKPLIAVLTCVVTVAFCSTVCGSDEKNPDNVKPEVEVEVLRPIYISPYRKENCRIWVELGYENAQDVIDNNLTIYESKPPGPLDDEVYRALLKSLDERAFMSTNSRTDIIYHGNGRKEHRFTYYSECNVLGESAEKPNKSLKQDTSAAGAS